MSLIFYSEEEDNDREESVNKYKNLFSTYENNSPSLKEALTQMFKSIEFSNYKVAQLVEDILDKCKEKIDQRYDEIKKKYENISKEDAYIICSYTCESKERKYSPYRILNQSLVSDNRQNGVRNISKYLYILLKSLRKLPRYYPKNKYLYRCLTCKVNLSKDPMNEKLVPYIAGNRKTFWGFTSTSPDPKMTYSFLKKENKIKTGTIFTLGGDIWGYDIALFNYYNEKEILLEPERRFIVDNVLPPVNNDIIDVACTILKTPLVLGNKGEDINLYNDMEDDININNIDLMINQYLIRLEMEVEINGKNELASGIGILCNIPIKKLKALITYNHLINFDFLNEGKKIILYINNKEIEIDLKQNRYKYTNKDLDITIIEILEKDNIKKFIGLDKFLNSRNYIGKDIICLSLKDEKNIEMQNGIIKEKNNNNYISSIETKKEGIIMLKENLKLIGLMKENKEIIPMNIIINKINFIKCIYNINEDNIGKEIRIINNENYKFNKNEEIEKEIKLIIKGEIKFNIWTYKFDREGIHVIYLITYNHLTNMSYMFYNCTNLKEINLLSFDTSQVKDMSYLFYNCSSLKELNLDSFNTSKVINMSFMFGNCSLLKEINISSFDTIRVKDMTSMFENCSSLNEINILKFNTSNVINMSYMFNNCSSLKKLDLSSFNTENVIDMSRMFLKCSSLKELDVSSFNTENVTDMSSMFNGCSSITYLSLLSFKTQNVTNMSSMFYNCSSLKDLFFISAYLPLNTTDKVTNMSCMFYNCSSLKELNLSAFNTGEVKDMSCMFYNCSSLEELNLSSFDTEKVMNMSSIFNECSSLKELNLSSFRTNKGINTMFMFNSINKYCKVKCKDENILKELKEFENKQGIIYKILKKIYY